MSTGLSHDQLRTLFLFEKLSDDRLDWLAANGVVESHASGTDVFAEGEPATCFYVLLSGTVSLRRAVGADVVEVTRTDQRGVYAGATQAYIQSPEGHRYANSLRAVTDCEFFVLPADTFAGVMREWFPMALHLLEGLFWGMRNSNAVIGQRERLLALGSLAAGLTHELNNPAAAAVRATAGLRERINGMRHKLAMIAQHDIDPEQLSRLVVVQEEAVEKVAKAPRLSALEIGDREDEMSDWMDEHGIGNAWRLAPVFVAGGLDTAWAQSVLDAVDDDFAEGAFAWLAYSVETETMMGEIDDAVARISSLVEAARQYSSLDRAPFQVTDLRDGLDSTLVMLGAKIGPDVAVTKDYADDVPPIPGYPAELNQVWTNLIDNALAAMSGSGRLRITTRLVNEHAEVEVADSGPGIPPEVRVRIFEPFFTTKPVGQGTGLGLDIAYRIVVNRHHGDLTVISSPGDTRFLVRLPLEEAPALSA